MVLKINCADNANLKHSDFGDIFKMPVEGRPHRGDTLVALDGTKYLVENVVISNNNSNSEYIRWRVQAEYFLKKL